MTIKEFLEKNKMSQRDLARAIGVSDVYVSDLVRGNRRASRAVAERIADFTNGDVSQPELLAHLVPEGYELRRVEKPGQAEA